MAGTSSGAAPPRTTDGPPAARAGQTGRPRCNVQHATGGERPLAGSHPSIPFSPYEYCTLQYTLGGGIAGPALPSRSPAGSGSDARRPGHGGGRRDRAIASAPGVRSTAGTASRLLRRAGTSAQRAQAWKHAGSRQARLIFYRDVQLLRTYSLHLWPALLHHAAAELASIVSRPPARASAPRFSTTIVLMLSTAHPSIPPAHLHGITHPRTHARAPLPTTFPPQVVRVPTGTRWRPSKHVAHAAQSTTAALSRPAGSATRRPSRARMARRWHLGPSRLSAPSASTSFPQASGGRRAEHGPYPRA